MRELVVRATGSAVTTIGFFVPTTQLYLSPGTIAATKIPFFDRKNGFFLRKNQFDSTSSPVYPA
jgi:hypothetical protein